MAPERRSAATRRQSSALELRLASRLRPICSGTERDDVSLRIASSN
jgi:hypothetical protein